jgi:hypothetical protein
MILTATTALGYAVVIQYKRDGLWRLLSAPGLLVLLLNVIANYVELAFVFGWPRPGEYTISRRMKRMQNDPDEIPARRELARMVQVFLDACEPDGKH